MEKFYVLSFDLGVTSIGWSVLDMEGKIVKVHGRPMWGVVKFDEGKLAKDCRLARSTRRRYERRRIRIDQLQMLMAPLVLKEDKDFFRRLDMTFLMQSDRDENSPRDFQRNLFNGFYNDRKYYKKYPTVYHLRRDLCEKPAEKFDIRLVYLAIHHLIKYRGNFLHDEQNIEVKGDGVKRLIEDFLERYSVSLDLGEIDAQKVYAILTDRQKKKLDKEKELLELGKKNNKTWKMICQLLSGRVCEPVKLLDLDAESKKLVFGKEDFDENLDYFRDKLDEVVFQAIVDAQSIYLEKTFVDILGEGNRYAYQGMIKKFDQHREDLKELKALLKIDYSDLYYKTFKMPRKIKGTPQEKKAKEEEFKKSCNYANYMRTSTTLTRYRKGCSREEFYTFLKKEILPNVAESEKKADILQKIELDQFLLKINDTVNGAIPYQIQRNELEKIIDNQSKFYPELIELKDKIVSILTFRRPYSVGVLKNNEGSRQFGWIEQKIDEKIYPWNFFDLVNVNAANEKFVARMVGRDKFTGEKVLPLESVTYQKYIVLNELNNLRFNNKPLSIDAKKVIFDEVAMTGKSITVGSIAKKIKEKFGMTGELSGFADKDGKKLTGSLKTYASFCEKLGAQINKITDKKLDEIAEILTVFTDRSSKKEMLKNCLKNVGIVVTSDLIENLAKMQLKGWGKYSSKLLLETYSSEATPRNIITLLKETDKNMMSILYSEEYGFAEQTVQKAMRVDVKDYEHLIEPLHASPADKKVVWQTFKVVEEVQKIMGCLPAEIYIETTRDPDEKKQKDTRRDKLKKLYASIKNDVETYNELAPYLFDGDEVAKKINLSEYEKLDAEKVYLYFIQCGRCMYTGEKIDLDQLSKYEVDHIIPRSLIVKNGFENKALVLREANQRKRNLALPYEVRNRQKAFWEQLKNAELISDTKFNNLMKEEWTEQDLRGFVERQLTETAQINKAVAEVLTTAYPELMYRVKTVRAKLSSLMRSAQTDDDPVKYGNFYKLRSLNDYHHAKDACLAGTFGLFTTYYFRNWGQNQKALALKELLEAEGAGLSAEQTQSIHNKRYGIIIDALRGELREKTFETYPDDEGEIHSSVVLYNNLLANMDRYDIPVVKLKEYCASGSFYNQQPVGADVTTNKRPLRYVRDKDDRLIPLDPDLYGGYSGEQQAYFVKVVYTKGKKQVAELVGVPTIVAKRSETEKNAVLEYLKEQLGESATVIGQPIRKYQLIKYKGQMVYITAATEVANAQQFIVDKRYGQLLAAIEKEKTEKTPDFESLAKEFVMYYIEKIKTYYPLYSGIAEKVNEFVRTDFDSLSAGEKGKYIECLLRVVSGGRVGNADAKYKMSGSWGRLNSKTISDDVIWYDQSITGYYVTKKKGF